MSIQKYAYALISCFVLCSCFIEEETESENLMSGQPNVLPSSSTVELDPLFLECPPEDIAEYPIPDESIPPSVSETGEIMDGFCPPVKVSVEELSFGAKGGVRCVTTSTLSHPSGSGCRTEFEIVSDSVNVPPTFFNVKRFKKEICPWLTAMKAGERVIYISVDKNETGNERKMVMGASAGNCHGWFTITQSAE